MARLARGEYLDPHSVQITHVISRCVRRAFLCGQDPISGKSFEHRREWIRKRLEFLASIFAIDCLTYAVMNNHVHLILRSRPDIVRLWSDEEVVRRWLTACPPWKNGKVSEADDLEINRITNDPGKVGELRSRLSDVSWWMRLTTQKIAQQANREDEVTGHFWEGRFQAQLLLDEAAVLACAMYVDLNPIRAAMAQSLEDSQFTGAQARVEDLKESKIVGQPSHARDGSKTTKRRQSAKPKRIRRWERSRGRKRCGWLTPIEIAESADPTGPDPSGCGRRASLKGFLNVPLLRYLELLDWTGRQLRADKRGGIPDSVTPILKRLGLDSDSWMTLVDQLGRLFKRAIGSPISLSTEAERRNQRWLQGPRASLLGK